MCGACSGSIINRRLALTKERARAILFTDLSGDTVSHDNAQLIVCAFKRATCIDTAA